MNTAPLSTGPSADDAITMRIPRSGDPCSSPRVLVHPRFDPRRAPTTPPRQGREARCQQTLPSAGIVVRPQAMPAGAGIELRWVAAFVVSVLLIASATLVATVMQLFA